MFDFHTLATEIVQGVRGALSLAEFDIVLASDASDATLFSAFADPPSAQGDLAHLGLRPALKNTSIPPFSSSLTIATLIRELSPRQSKHRGQHTILFQGFPDLLESQPPSCHLPPPRTIADWCERVDGVGTLETDSPPAQPQAAPSRFIGANEDTEGNALETNNSTTRTPNVEDFPAVGPVPVTVQPSAQGHLTPKRHRPPAQPPYTAAEHSGQSFSIPRLTATGCPPMLTSNPTPTSHRRILHTPCISSDPSGQSFSSPVTVQPIAQHSATIPLSSPELETRLHPLSMPHMAINDGPPSSRHRPIL